jgi:hypothetical protein
MYTSSAVFGGESKMPEVAVRSMHGLRGSERRKGDFLEKVRVPRAHHLIRVFGAGLTRG